MNKKKALNLAKEFAANPKGVKFSNLAKLCEFYFGKPRNKSSSHHVYKMPWSGDPRINIQNNKGEAKAYQVKQVLKAIEKLESDNGSSE